MSSARGALLGGKPGTMAKNKTNSSGRGREEYDFSKGVRGKYSKRFASGSKVIVLEPDVAKVFPDSQTVNDALRGLAAIAQRHAGKSG